MPRKLRQELAESEILRERALRCRQLADGAGNLEFAIKLNAISDEYECDAKRTEPEVISIASIIPPIKKSDDHKVVKNGHLS